MILNVITKGKQYLLSYKVKIGEKRAYANTLGQKETRMLERDWKEPTVTEEEE